MLVWSRKKKKYDIIVEDRANHTCLKSSVNLSVDGMSKKERILGLVTLVAEWSESSRELNDHVTIMSWFRCLASR